MNQVLSQNDLPTSQTSQHFGWVHLSTNFFLPQATLTLASLVQNLPLCHFDLNDACACLSWVPLPIWYQRGEGRAFHVLSVKPPPASILAGGRDSADSHIHCPASLPSGSKLCFCSSNISEPLLHYSWAQPSPPQLVVVSYQKWYSLGLLLPLS